jgi:chemotaxis protein methyltransferase CheR
VRGTSRQPDSANEPERQSSSARRDHTIAACDDPGYRSFRRHIKSLTGLDLAIYKPGQMMRRIKGLMERRRLATLGEYSALLSRDRKALEEFVHRTTVNVSEMFRNPEKFRALRDIVFPELLAARRRLRIWSAGCSYGAEPYSLAIVLSELTPGVAHHILATDIDEGVLDRAKTARFSANDVKGVEPKVLTRCFDPDGDGFRLKAAFAERVEFRKHNLLADFYGSDYDLITCRNVVIYFTDEAKAKVWRGFLESLRPGGYLFVGGAEMILNSSEIGYEMPLRLFYRKPDGRALSHEVRAA